MEELRGVVREKTAQLKVLTETIESLQLGSGTDGDGVASGLVAHQSNQALIKRVVELSSDLCAQTNCTQMAERKVVELEADRTKKARLCNSLQSQLHESTLLNEKLRSQYKSVAQELINIEKTRRDERMEARLENEEIARSLQVCAWH